MYHISRINQQDQSFQNQNFEEHPQRYDVTFWSKGKFQAVEIG